MQQTTLSNKINRINNWIKMAKHLRIKPSDKMSDAINNNAQILMSMSRFGISLGFG